MHRSTRFHRLARVLIPTVAGLLFAAGCSHDPVRTRSFEGREWILQRAAIDSVEVYPGDFVVPVSITFLGGKYAGDDGCNSFGGRYDTRLAVVNPRDPWATERACFVPGYRPVHLESPFTVDVRDNEMTVRTNRSTHIYEAR